MKSRQWVSSSASDVPTIACSIQYWTVNENQCQIPDDDLSAQCYHEKETKKQDGGQKPQNIRHGQYYQVKQHFVASRGGTWILPNKRPDHLRDSVRELEEILKSHSVLCVRWVKRNRIQMMVQTGMMVNILVSETHDIKKLAMDKSLTSKIPADTGTICAAALTDRFCLLSFSERNKLGFVSYTQRPGTPEHKQISSKISSMDMKISFHDIPGTPNRKYDRKFSVNKKGDMAICWCSSFKGPTTWTPTSTEEERANMILLSCSFGRMEVCSYVQTEYTPVSVEFSRLNPYQIHTLEKSIGARSESFLHYTVYEVTQGKIQRLNINTIPLKSGILSSARNKTEDKVVIGCTDGSVMIYNVLTKAVSTVRDSLVPSVVSWHPNSGVVMVASGSAELRCYDSALAPLSSSLMGTSMLTSTGSTVKLSKFLSAGNGLVSLAWPDTVDEEADDSAKNRALQINTCEKAALLLFDGGPFAILKLHLGVKTGGSLRPVEITKEYLNLGNVQRAVQVMHSVNWNTDGLQAFLILTLILNYLLKLPLNFQREGQLEAVLSAFYAPKIPLPELVVVEYRHSISRYARRLYHHLLRFGRFEKAFLLAKDIQDHDLFVDLYFCAQEAGEIPIAKAAKQLAYELQSSGSSEEDFYSDEDAHEEQRHLSTRGKSRHSTPPEREKMVQKPRLKREIPSSYPPPKMDDFMNALMNEARVVVEQNNRRPLNSDKNVVETGSSSSTLKVMHLGYV